MNGSMLRQWWPSTVTPVIGVPVTLVQVTRGDA
jgi:hypothetical protein